MDHVFSNQSIHLSIRLMYYHAYVRSRLCYLCGCWNISQKLRKKIETCHMKHLRVMVSGGKRRKGGPREMSDEVGYNFAFVYKNLNIYKICKTDSVLNFADAQKAKWCAHVIRCDNDRVVKQTMFDESQNSREGMKGMTSVLDQFLKITREHDMEDGQVYRACIDRNLFCELDTRGVIFASQHDEIE